MKFIKNIGGKETSANFKSLDEARLAADNEFIKNPEAVSVEEFKLADGRIRFIIKSKKNIIYQLTSEKGGKK